MTYARHHLVTPDSPGTYHCYSRCVRRAFLCGLDKVTGRCFDHRKLWVEERLLFLAESFAVSVQAYAVMSNHIHVVVHIDPLAPKDWPNEDVARRWLRMFRDSSDKAPPFEQQVRTLMSDEDRIEVLRTRLGSLSWFMRSLLQPIARMANLEDEVTGRFWEGRFKSQALLDERAVLGAMAYVDLNPMRAGLATSVEQSKHTSLKRRWTEGADNRPLRPVGGLLGAPMPDISESAYLELVRWAWDARSANESGHVPPPCGTGHLISNTKAWTEQLEATESRYGLAIGSLDKLMERARNLGQKWLKGVGFARRLTRSPPLTT